MNKDLARYINILLAEKQREVSSKQNYLERTNLDPERHFVERQEIEYELSMIYRCQKAMDYFIEEDELNYPPHLRGDVIAKAKQAFAHTNKKEEEN